MVRSPPETPPAAPFPVTPSQLCGASSNGPVSANTLLLGNQINPLSAVAQKMTDTLHAELQAHSIYKEEDDDLGSHHPLVGPALPGKKQVTGVTSPLRGPSTPWQEGNWGHITTSWAQPRPPTVQAWVYYAVRLINLVILN